MCVCERVFKREGVREGKMADTAVIRAREARKVILGGVQAVSPTTVTTSNTGPSEFTVSDDRTGRFVRVNTGKRNVIVLKVVKADLPTSASLQLPVFREYGKAAGPEMVWCELPMTAEGAKQCADIITAIVMMA